ncbi:DUF3276 family protein [Entomospira culicis]|uniref:PUR family DNA/RNA-binding protein n=1 Tax=Entomospira culicis TaxID=2719989 RepID=A0A968GEM0_9SPIO|nr:DUF3276 family protein [Entomospira culicis]NIZ18407.1 PUR family DNA/RNA-binding protein [Entomospira culicis]NIZ68623.1 PUR family DNA/RNA-binding protein [Entomospira culicis]WDI37223.1 DUF3276 family protein [Entomospira culicis]WDI38851.1 DUF3276 family protein [Entomospira culicis]
MGERGEIDSSVIYTQHGQKTYFINVKENRFRDLFLVIAESVKNESEGFDRFALNVFEEDLNFFETHLLKAQTLLEQLEKQSFASKELPDSWAIKSSSGSGERYFKFSLHRRARMLQVVIAERKFKQTSEAFARTVRIDAESLAMFIRQYQRMKKRLFERKEIRDNEPLRDPKLIEKYRKKSEDAPKVVRKVVVKRRQSADNQG